MIARARLASDRLGASRAALREFAIRTLASDRLGRCLRALREAAFGILTRRSNRGRPDEQRQRSGSEQQFTHLAFSRPNTGHDQTALIDGTRQSGMPQTPGTLIIRSVVASIHAGRATLKKDRIVAVGLLTQRDLDVLDAGFHRLFSVVDNDDEDDGFADLLARLDKIDAITLDREAPDEIKTNLRGNR